jgi:hypothetical protein
MGYEGFKQTPVKEYKPQNLELIPNRFRGVSKVMPDEDYGVNSGSDVKKYDRIALNPVVNTPLNALLIGTFWGGYTIQSVNDYERYPEFEELDDQLITMINDQIYDMSYETFDNTLKAILWDGMNFGFPMAEMVFDQKGGLNVVEAIKTKPPFNFNLWANEVDDLEKTEHTPTSTMIDKEQLPKFVTGAYPFLRDGNHYGTSIVKSIAFDVELLEILEEAQTRGIKMLTIRPIIHWEKNKDRTQEEINIIRNAIFNVESASVVSLPMDLIPGAEDGGFVKADEIEVLDDRASPEGVALINEVIDMLQKRITRNLGLPDDLGFTSSGVGSFAKAKEEMDMFLAFVNRNQQYIKDIVNSQIIPAMVQYNFSSFPDKYRLPNLVFESIEENHMEKMASTVQSLIQSGVIKPDEPWIRELLDVPPAPVDEIDTEKTEDQNDENLVIQKNNLMAKIKGVLFGK